MRHLKNGITDRTVYPVRLINRGQEYLTLYYYTEEKKNSDYLLHDGKSIVYFASETEMKAFCEKNELNADGETVDYDFDAPIDDPIEYCPILENWNMLNTAAWSLGMYFEGNRDKYNGLYELLFRLNTPLYPPDPPFTYTVGKRNLEGIRKVFRKKDRFFKRFTPYAN